MNLINSQCTKDKLCGIKLQNNYHKKDLLSIPTSKMNTDVEIHNDCIVEEIYGIWQMGVCMFIILLLIGKDYVISIN